MDKRHGEKARWLAAAVVCALLIQGLAMPVPARTVTPGDALERAQAADASAAVSFSADGVEVAVTGTGGAVQSVPATAGYWNGGSGWMYVDKGNYLALANGTLGTLKVTSGRLPVAVAGLSKIKTLDTGNGGSVVIGGNGILLLDEIKGSGSVYLAGTALFLKDASGAYVLQANAGLSEHYVLPAGNRYVVPSGVTLTLEVVDRNNSYDTVNVARLGVPAGSELRVESGGTLAMKSDFLYMEIRLPQMDIQGKLVVCPGGNVGNTGTQRPGGRIAVAGGGSLLVQPGGLVSDCVLDLNAGAAGVEAIVSGGRISAIPDTAGAPQAAPWKLNIAGDTVVLRLDEIARASGLTTYTLVDTVIGTGATLAIQGHDTTSATLSGQPGARPAPRVIFSGGIAGGGNLSLQGARVDASGDVSLGRLSINAGTLDVNGALTAAEQDIQGALNVTGDGTLQLLSETVPSGGPVPLYTLLMHQVRNPVHRSREVWAEAIQFPGGYTGPALHNGSVTFAELSAGLPSSINAPYTPANPVPGDDPHTDYKLDRFEIHGLDSAGYLRTWLISIDDAFSADVSGLGQVLYVTAVYTYCESGPSQAGGVESNTISDTTMDGILGDGDYVFSAGEQLVPIGSSGSGNGASSESNSGSSSESSGESSGENASGTGDQGAGDVSAATDATSHVTVMPGRSVPSSVSSRIFDDAADSSERAVQATQSGTRADADSSVSAASDLSNGAETARGGLPPLFWVALGVACAALGVLAFLRVRVRRQD